MVVITEFQRFGVFFLLFGVLLYFDSVLLAFGNILFLAGLAFIIGLRRTAHFLFQRQKLRGSTFFLGGVALVLLRWPRMGMLAETYGFVLLFKSFFPVAFGFLGTVLNMPFLTTFVQKQLLNGMKALRKDEAMDNRASKRLQKHVYYRVW